MPTKELILARFRNRANFDKLFACLNDNHGDNDRNPEPTWILAYSNGTRELRDRVKNASLVGGEYRGPNASECNTRISTVTTE